MALTVPIAGRPSNVKAPVSASISVALNAARPFTYQLLNAQVTSVKGLYFGLYLSGDSGLVAGSPQYRLNGMKVYTSTHYHEESNITVDEAQAIDPVTFVPTPTTISGKTVKTQPGSQSETPFPPDWTKTLTHAHYEPFPGFFFDEERANEFNYSPTFNDGLTFLQALNFATQWTASPNLSLAGAYGFRRYGSGLSGPIDGTIQAVPGSTLLPTGTVTRPNLRSNPLIATSGIDIGNQLTSITPDPGIFTNTTFAMNRLQIKFLSKDVNYFFAQRIGSRFRYLPATQGVTVIGQIIEFPAPDFTDLPKLVAGGTEAAHEFATILIAGQNFNAYVNSVGGTAVSSW